jgi:hypothetical protein
LAQSALLSKSEASSSSTRTVVARASASASAPTQTSEQTLDGAIDGDGIPEADATDEPMRAEKPHIASAAHRLLGRLMADESEQN